MNDDNKILAVWEVRKAENEESKGVWLIMLKSGKIAASSTNPTIAKPTPYTGPLTFNEPTYNMPLKTSHES